MSGRNLQVVHQRLVAKMRRSGTDAGLRTALPISRASVVHALIDGAFITLEDACQQGPMVFLAASDGNHARLQRALNGIGEHAQFSDVWRRVANDERHALSNLARLVLDPHVCDEKLLLAAVMSLCRSTQLLSNVLLSDVLCNDGKAGATLLMGLPQLLGRAARLVLDYPETAMAEFASRICTFLGVHATQQDALALDGRKLEYYLYAFDHGPDAQLVDLGTMCDQHRAIHSHRPTVAGAAPAGSDTTLAPTKSAKRNKRRRQRAKELRDTAAQSTTTNAAAMS